jgi:HipA-like kinase
MLAGGGRGLRACPGPDTVPGVSVTDVQTLRAVRATRYVTALREGGSLPGLVEADDDGLYVAKFRGAGQGTRALVAEVIAGELGRALGVLVPELVALEVDPRLAAAEPDPEIQDLIAASAGVNLGVDFLPGALAYVPGGGWEPNPARAAEIVWLDAFLTNVDRTPRNPNLLVWHGRLWAIDHGAALYLQHGGLADADPARPFPMIAEHVLLGRASSIVEAGERLGAAVDRDLIARVVGLVPVEWFAADGPGVYVDYLTARAGGAGFAAEAEDARRR